MWCSILTLYDALHGFRAGRGTGTETLEENSVQQLVGIAHKPLFQVFLDVRKAYDLFGYGSVYGDYAGL